MKSLLFLLSLLVLNASAQRMSVVEKFSDIAGRPFFPKQYQDVNGTPFLLDDWTGAKIELTNGQILENVKANINLVTDELNYQDETGNAMVAKTENIKSIEFTGSLGKRFIPTPARNGFLEALTEGNASLLKRHKKVIVETKPYNSATVQKNFVETEVVLLSWDGQLSEIRKSDDLFELLLPSDDLKVFAKESRLKKRSADDWIRIVKRFNGVNQ